MLPVWSRCVVTGPQSDFYLGTLPRDTKSVGNCGDRGEAGSTVPQKRELAAKMNYGTGEFMREIVAGFVIALAAGIGFVGVAASPASAQVYVEGASQGAGAVLSSTGARPASGGVLPNTGQQAVGGVLSQTGALPFQVSGSGSTATATPQASVQGLAFTGADIASLVTVALAAMTLGVVLTRRARPRAEG